ncbi:MAG TPA: efflux RND transporter periplasmic adaptor subunit, partial [Bryobacteraceae bacterium]
MQPDLKSLRIDRSQKPVDQPAPWAVRWIFIGVGILIALGAARFIYGKLTAATEVNIVRVHAAAPLV